ncbi:Protease HtpX [Botrimarina colliarenosi]|uniref:Protease HtpX n=1 Tax=Botrimarina colliarenosi TaxID=2528001 RepID=A0A5C6ALR5_9BACT|nr:M48 family metalloprotease [Botrimarina colliarenosi]TWU00407.1 Protease HtpX [Botrimarina colliarenosi]
MDLPGRDLSPTRDELLARHARDNAGASMAFALRCSALIAALVLIDWRGLSAEPLPAGIFLAVMLGRYLADLVPLAGRKRKQIRDLRPETKFGVHDRQSLLSLVSDVEARLGIPANRYPVYLVREKSLNAAAVSLGLDSLLGRVDGVYLHRQTLHVLEPRELAFVIGHELGHCHRYYLKSSRWELLNLLLVAAAGLAAVPLASGWGWLGVFGLGLLAVAVLYAMRSQSLASIRTIEHLCDDYGARAAGVVNGVNALLKIASESEAANRVTRFCLEVGRQRGDIDPLELMAEYEKAAPFGKLDPAEADRFLAASLQEVERRKQGLSLRGMLDYLNDSEVDEDALDELRVLWKRLDEVQAIDWTKPLRETGAKQLTEEQIDRVVAALAANPAAVLSRTPEELAEETTHPTTRKRVLYLWQNRDAIKAAANDTTGDGARGNPYLR